MRRDLYSSRDLLQLIWGVALVVMGVAFFFRISVIMEQAKDIEYLASARVFLRIAFYFMAVILLGGGIKKIRRFMQIKEKADEHERERK
ncbi:MAG: hypothetical protein K9J79_04455 [Desulfobacteraceae bacterium]|nr:hypothetical protein [Desulfobacteraceae bacterium]MCF8094592.1 hypothetical protein [Desulfobacteraceae bacterium]